MSDLRVRRGDTGSFDVAVLKRDGTPQPITDWTFRFTIKTRVADVDPGLWQGTFTPPSTSAGITITDALGGLLAIDIPKATTAALPAPSTLLWDLQATDGSGKVTTIDSGKLYVLPDVTLTS